MKSCDHNSSLTDTQQQILAVEAQFWKTAGAKENHIKEQLGLTPTRYYQLLTQLIHSPAAVQADPVLVKRLQRIARKDRRQ